MGKQFAGGMRHKLLLYGLLPFRLLQHENPKRVTKESHWA
jgi:hypothetical protein